MVLVVVMMMMTMMTMMTLMMMKTQDAEVAKDRHLHRTNMATALDLLPKILISIFCRINNARD